jgi:hypothetical protein
MTAVDRYTKRWVTLPDGRKLYGRVPGASSVVILEHRLRDDLARHVRGVTEAVLPYGRADVMTEQSVFEVEPAGSWRAGVRQVLAYAAQTGLPPSLALFGEAHRDLVLKIYLRLRDGSPAIVLWWHNGWSWERITSRAACRNMKDPQSE